MDNSAEITKHSPILEAMERVEAVGEVESIEEAESVSVPVVKKLSKAESVLHRLKRRAISARARSAQTKARIEFLENTRKKYQALKKAHKALKDENSRLTLELAKPIATRDDAQLVIEAKGDDEPLLV